ncbi:MAG: hypothetical protein KIS78_30785, partial [Labilithrix sp.]|nr:hypothetical protein [Labilithrix sp.]
MTLGARREPERLPSEASRLADLLRRLGERSADPHRLAAGAMEALAAALGAPCALVFAVDPTDALRLVGARGIDAELEARVSSLAFDGQELAAE